MFNLFRYYTIDSLATNHFSSTTIVKKLKKNLNQEYSTNYTRIPLTDYNEIVQRFIIYTCGKTVIYCGNNAVICQKIFNTLYIIYMKLSL